MVLVLGYNNNSETGYLIDILNDMNIDYKYSLLEPQIIKADRIILPHPLNFNSAYRKMNMMNLFSLLRLIKKPILGINNGSKMMCNQLLDKFKYGLGFFNLDVSLDVEGNDQKYVSGEIKITGDSRLLNKECDKTLIKFNQSNQSIWSQYSKIAIAFENINYSLTREHENYYSVDMNFELNETVAREIIFNFCKIT